MLPYRHIGEKGSIVNMFQVKLGTCSDDVYHNECMIKDLLKDFNPYECVELLNGNKIPFTYDDKGNIIEYCFINEPDINEIRNSFIKFEQRQIIPLPEAEVNHNI